MRLARGLLADGLAVVAGHGVEGFLSFFLVRDVVEVVLLIPKTTLFKMIIGEDKFPVSLIAIC